VPYRIVQVNPEPAADRTRINLQEWHSVAAGQSIAARVLEILGGYQKAVESSGVSKLAVIKRVNASLTDLQPMAGSGETGEGLAEHINLVTLPALTQEIESARKHAKQQMLLPLLGDVIQELTATAGLTKVSQ